MDRRLSVRDKTAAKKEFLLSDGDLNSLRHWLKPIKYESANSNSESTEFKEWRPKYMKLFLVSQLTALSHEKWGSAQGVEAERNRRTVARMQRAISSARKKRRVAECLNDIEPDADVVAEFAAKKHIHSFSAKQCVNAETDEWSKKCTQCGYTETWEEF